MNSASDNLQHGSEEGKGYEMRGYGYSDDTVSFVFITCKQSLVRALVTCDHSVSWLHAVTLCAPHDISIFTCACHSFCDLTVLSYLILSCLVTLPQMTLEQCSAELADTLGADASSGPPVWRVVAISALSSVLTFLGPFRNQEHAKFRGE